ncbi:hypothetical protein SODALDRAFT_329415, partial [Sodiomyces alkalinus F11]
MRNPGVPFTSGHAAENDAHFALRALLLLAVRDAQRLSHVHGYTSIAEEVVLQRLQDIALGPRPVSEEDLLAARIKANRERTVTDLEKKWLTRAMKQARKSKGAHWRDQEIIPMMGKRLFLELLMRRLYERAEVSRAVLYFLALDKTGKREFRRDQLTQNKERQRQAIEQRARAEPVAEDTETPV